MSKGKTILLKIVQTAVPHLKWKAIADDQAVVKLHKDKDADRTLYFVMDEKRSIFTATSKWSAWIGWADADSKVPEEAHFGEDDIEYDSPKEAYDAIMADLALLEGAFGVLSGRKAA